MQEKSEKQNDDQFQNPVDKDKVAENPHSLPYAHTVGSALIKPVDKGRIKGRALSAMYEQTDMQLAQIRKQIDLLAEQAAAIRNRIELSEQIYQAEMNFTPLVGHFYHLYEKENGSFVLSMVGPEEWGKSCPYHFHSSARLLADHTWEVVKL